MILLVGKPNEDKEEHIPHFIYTHQTLPDMVNLNIAPGIQYGRSEEMK